MRLFRSSRTSIIGLDIGSSTIKLVALDRGRTAWTLRGAAELPTPADSISDGFFTEPVVVAETIGQLLRSVRTGRTHIAAALSGHAVIVKRLTLPAMSDAQLAEAIVWEAEQYIPFDLSEVRLDHQVLSRSTSGPASLEVLLVAAKRDRIEDRAAVIVQAGGEPAVLDVEAFALANAYEMNHPDRHDPLTALIHVGRQSTIVCLVEQHQPAFTRDVPLGGHAHTDALVREFNIDEPTAERMTHGQGPGSDQVKPILREATHRLVGEIKKTIDFYRATSSTDQLSRVVVSGGASGAEALVELLGAELNAPVEIFDPCRQIRVSTSRRGGAALGPSFAIAVGLALRSSEEHAA